MDTNPVNPGSTEGAMPEPEAPVQSANEQLVTPPQSAQPGPQPVTADVAPPAAAGPQPPQNFQPTAMPAASGPVVVGVDTGAPAVTLQPPVPTGTPVTGGVMGGPVVSGGKRNFRKLLVPLVAVVAVLGLGAGVYAGYYVPNKPENVLKSAVVNTLKQRNISSSTDYEVSPTSSAGGPAMKITAATSSNLDAKAADVTLDVTVSGVSLPVEARLVDQNLYIKAGDLSTLSTLADTFMPGAGGALKTLSDSVSNQWIEVDSTLLKQAGATCFLNASWSLTNDDIAYLEKQYQTNQFVAIKSSGNDTVGGKAAKKFVLAMNDNKLANYVKSLTKLSVFKNMAKCGSGSTAVPDTGSLADGDTTPLTVWVDKSTKRIVKVAMQSTAQDNTKSHIEGSLTTTLSYGPVKVIAPQGAKPAAQVLAQLEAQLGATDPGFAAALGSGLFSSGSLDSSASTDTGGDARARDAQRQSDIQSLQTQLEAFFAQNAYYPSLADMNSASWRSGNMPSLDSAAMQDPQGSSQTLVRSPAPKLYSYEVTDVGGQSCEADDTTCAQYTLTATLESGGTYQKVNLD